VNINNLAGVRPAALAALLFAELMVVSFSFDAHQAWLINSDQWFSVISLSGQFAKLIVVVLVFSTLGLLPRLPDLFNSLQHSNSEYRYGWVVGAHILSYFVFLWCTAQIFGQGSSAENIPQTLVLVWIVTLIATGIFWLLSVAPFHYWRRLILSEATVFVSALVVGIFALVLAAHAQTLWTPLSDLTFQLSAALLNLIYPEIIVDPELKLLGAKGFVVNIAPECSGYEGMALMAVFTGFYLSIFRNDFRFPQALLLFPMGIVIIWFFNNLRIAALIAIGASFSPEVAIGGFHSQAGWISFIIVIVMTLSLAYRTPYFIKTRIINPSKRRLNLPMALLIPFIILLALTIITSALSAEFDWLYPLRVVAVTIALTFCWRVYQFSRFRFEVEPWIGGGLVFVLWILLVPNDPVKDVTFAAELFAEPQAIVWAWLIFRFLGAVVTVPLAEELLFRGYLISRLAQTDIILEGRIKFSWIAYIASSILFGLLHADWVAGITAGIIFGWIRYRSHSIWASIVAHASTNLMLSIYVFSTGKWSIW